MKVEKHVLDAYRIPSDTNIQTTRLAIIVAADKNNGIGYQGKIPWHLPADMRYFKTTTMGHHLIMGRRTWESINRHLPGRKIIVISRTSSYQNSTVTTVTSLAMAVNLVHKRHENVAFICGGAMVYEQALPIIDQIYLTRIHDIFSVDTYLPPINPSNWCMQSITIGYPDTQNPYPYSFGVYVKRLST